MKTSEVIEFFGTAVEAAKVLHCSSAAISQWGEYPPELRQHQIENVTNGKLRVTKNSADPDASSESRPMH